MRWNRDRTVRTLYLVNIIFWLGIFLSYLFPGEGGADRSRLLVAFIGLEPLLFLFFFIGYVKKWRILYPVSSAFLFVNAILSITDEVGALDIISLGLSVSLLIAILLQWRLMGHR